MEKDCVEDDVNKKTENNEIDDNSNNNNVEPIPSKPATNIKTEKLKSSQNNSTFTGLALLICIIGVSLGILLEIINVRNNTSTEIHNTNRIYCIHSNHSAAQTKTGFLKHIHYVLERLGYQKGSNDSPCHLIWSHEYAFKQGFTLKSHQKINQFPSVGYITSKVDLATNTESKYIPKAFKLPQNKNEFLKYAEKNKDAMFVQKGKDHRQVYLKPVKEIDLTSGKSFVQEFIQNPFLVDGHKFDIGVYVAITSVNPLRVYWYAGDILFRYCPAKYLPLDPLIYDKYVVADKYLPTWEVPSLAQLHNALGMSMKDCFDTYARSKGKDTAAMWEDIQKAIAEIFIKKEHFLDKALNNYKSREHFFQLLRFDFIVDENLKVYLMEVNLSPNLSSQWEPNQLLYEQILYNFFMLTGVATKLSDTPGTKTEREQMVSAQKNIAVFGEACSTACKDDCREMPVCQLCKPCLQPEMKQVLLASYREKLHKGDFRRIIPPLMRQTDILDAAFLESIKNLTSNNQLLHLWYQEKCNQDVSWCT